MGRKAISIESRIDSIIKYLNEPSNKVIKRDGKKVLCTSCNLKIEYTAKTLASRINDHVKSKQHNKSKEHGTTPSIIGLLNRMDDNEKNQKEFNKRLTQAFMAADIPLHKLKNPTLRQFLSNETHMKIPHRDTLRGTVIHEIYGNTIEKIKEKIKGMMCNLLWMRRLTLRIVTALMSWSAS